MFLPGVAKPSTVKKGEEVSRPVDISRLDLRVGLIVSVEKVMHLKMTHFLGQGHCGDVCMEAQGCSYISLWVWHLGHGHSHVMTSSDFQGVVFASLANVFALSQRPGQVWTLAQTRSLL